jgi:hypothetical protein
MFRLLEKMTMLCIVGLGFALALGGCYDSRMVLGGHPGYENSHPGPPPWAPAHGYRAKHDYRYYPDSEVYYDVGRGLYFYIGGDHWQVSGKLPARFQVDVEDYVALEMNSSKPYQYHSDVVKWYPPGQKKKASKGNGKGKNKNKR